MSDHSLAQISKRAWFSSGPDLLQNIVCLNSVVRVNMLIERWIWTFSLLERYWYSKLCVCECGRQILSRAQTGFPLGLSEGCLELTQKRGSTMALTCWSRSPPPNHSRWCFIVGHKWLSASVCLPASNLWFRDSLGECTSPDSAGYSIWENDPSFLVRNRISHLTFKLLTRGIWKK